MKVYILFGILGIIHSISLKNYSKKEKMVLKNEFNIIISSYNFIWPNYKSFHYFINGQIRNKELNILKYEFLRSDYDFISGVLIELRFAIYKDENLFNLVDFIIGSLARVKLYVAKQIQKPLLALSRIDEDLLKNLTYTVNYQFDLKTKYGNIISRNVFLNLPYLFNYYDIDNLAEILKYLKLLKGQLNRYRERNIKLRQLLHREFKRLKSLDLYSFDYYIFNSDYSVYIISWLSNLIKETHRDIFKHMDTKHYRIRNKNSISQYCGYLLYNYIKTGFKFVLSNIHQKFCFGFYNALKLYLGNSFSLEIRYPRVNVLYKLVERIQFHECLYNK